MFSALIIDGQQRNRVDLQRMLAGSDCVQVLGEADGMAAALEAMQLYAPNLLFLGMELADGSAFDLLERMGAGPMAAQVVLLADTERYAVRAFKYGVSDYIVRPFESNELLATLERLRAALAFAGVEPSCVVPERIALQTEGEVHMVPLVEVVRCEASGSATLFYLANGQCIRALGVLKMFEDKLKGRGFMRCHQSHLINLQRLAKVHRYPMPLATMDNGDQIPVSIAKLRLLI